MERTFLCWRGYRFARFGFGGGDGGGWDWRRALAVSIDGIAHQIVIGNEDKIVSSWGWEKEVVVVIVIMIALVMMIIEVIIDCEALALDASCFGWE